MLSLLKRRRSHFLLPEPSGEHGGLDVLLSLLLHDPGELDGQQVGGAGERAAHLLRRHRHAALAEGDPARVPSGKPFVE